MESGGIRSNMSHPRQAFWSVFVLACIGGVQILPYPSIYLNYAHYLFVCCLLLWNLHAVWWMVAGFKNLIPGLHRFLELFIAMFYVTTTFLQRQRFHECLDSLSAIDETLEILGTPNSFRQLRGRSWRVFFLLNSLPLVMVKLNWEWFRVLYGHAYAPYACFILTYTLWCNLIVAAIICLILKHVETRFDAVNNFMRRLARSRQARFGYKHRVVVHNHPDLVFQKHQEEIVWIAMRLYLRLSRLSKSFCRIFGFQIALEAASNCIYMAGIVEYHYKFTQHTVETTMRLMPGYLWGGLYIAKLFYFNHVCEAIVKKASSTRRVISGLMNSTVSRPIQKELAQFILYIICRPLRLSGGGFVYFGYDFVVMYLSSLSTIVVITLQMKTLVSEVQNRVESNATSLIDENQ